MRRLITLTAVIALMTVAVSTAMAASSFDTFDEKQGWACGEAEGLVDNHCINIRSNGKVLNIKVFEPDQRGPQESASFDPKVDGRPCPHDGGSSDGTWWEFAAGLWVCHHSGIQP